MTQDSKDNEKGISSDNHSTRNSQGPTGQISSKQNVIEDKTKYGYWSPEK
jgi:hypothetical protein